MSVKYRGVERPAVDNVTLGVAPGERLGIVGESGSGKTTLALSLTDLLPRSAQVVGGEVVVAGRAFSSLSRRDLRSVRGAVVGRVPQDSLSGLNPVIRIDHQLTDALRSHQTVSKSQARKQIESALGSVGLPDIPAKLRSYPHELSGGQRQRVLIAMAMINSPQVLVADEPTTALDTTVQAQVLTVLDRATASAGMALILISHNINVIAAVCDRVAVMYAGEVVEEGPMTTVIREPQHPYTKALIAAATGADAVRKPSVSSGTRPALASTEGCRYAPRCPIAFERCSDHPTARFSRGHLVRCFAVDEARVGLGEGG